MTTNRVGKISALVQATDLGEKMRSATPKYIHKLLGQELIQYSITSVYEAIGAKPHLVLEASFDQVGDLVASFVQGMIWHGGQGEQNSLSQILELLPETTEHLLVTSADLPLVTAPTLERLIDSHLLKENEDVPITMLTFHNQLDRHQPRLIRDEHGKVLGIDEGDHTQQDQLDDREIVSDCYSVSTSWLRELRQNSTSLKGMLSPRALLRVAISDGVRINTFNLENPQESLRIDSRLDLANAEAILRERVNHKLMLSGVTIIDPGSTYIEAEVKIGQDSVILPNTHLTGMTKIGGNCTIGPNTFIQDSNIGAHCIVNNSVVEAATLEARVDIGPYAHLRKGAHLAEGVHMGNFGEVKNSYLGQGTKMGHFSYVGDTTVGPEVNIGAGVITANYDGQRKHPTVIGEGAFIGSDTMLIAPLKIGEGARTGAGSVVTKDVPPNSLAVGMPARIIRKKEEDDGP